MSTASVSEAHPPRRRALAPLLAGGLLFVAAGALVAWLAPRARTPQPPPVLFSVPAFALTSQDGRAVTGDVLRGRPWIASFIFTQCGGVCPRMTSRLVRLRPDLPAQMRFVSITVDPATDSPARLAEYGRRLGAGPDWLFLTGDKSALYALATEGFKLAAFEVPPGQQAAGGDGPFLHSSKFALVDAAGGIRGYYDSDDEEALARLAADARAVAAAP